MMITKRLLLLFATALVLSTFSSCLDENTKGLLPEEKAYNSATNLYINTVATLYNYIGGNSDSQGLEGTVRGLYDYNTFSTDEAIIPIRGGDWYDGGFWQNLYEHRWTASDEALYNTWLYLYKVAMLCNHSLAVIDTNRTLLTDDEYQSYTAEIKAVRCLFYYELMDMFGRIPYVTQDQEAFTNVSQQERSTVFRSIIAELQACLPYLANEHSNLEGNYYGRMTRPVAQFLLARLLLNAEVYADDDWTDKQHPDGKTMSATARLRLQLQRTQRDFRGKHLHHTHGQDQIPKPILVSLPLATLCPRRCHRHGCRKRHLGNARHRTCLRLRHRQPRHALRHQLLCRHRKSRREGGDTGKWGTPRLPALGDGREPHLLALREDSRCTNGQIRDRPQGLRRRQSSVSPTCCSCAPRQKCETEKTDRVIWMLYAVAWACPAAPQRSTTSCVSGCSN